jgi:hypothetical protein
MGRLGHGQVKLLDLDALLMRGDRENQLPPWLNRLRDQRRHDGPAPALRVTSSSSSCANVSTVASADPVPAASRASFEG